MKRYISVGFFFPHWKSFIEKKVNLTEDEINELLYYYQQGIEIGKEESTLSIINNLIKLNFFVMNFF